MIELVWPWAFLLLLLPFAIHYLVPAQGTKEAALTVPQVDAFVFSDSEGNQRQTTKPILMWLLITLAWLALSTALSRPQWTGEPTVLPTISRDLVLALDISGSMAQADMQIEGREYTRFSVVKHAVQNFVSQRTGDRVGIVLFGSLPYVYVPMTPDVKTASQMLTDAPIGIAGRSTAIGDALGLAIKQTLEHPATHRVAVLMTDGASNYGELDPLEAAELATSYDVRVYTIGIVPSQSSGLVFSLFRTRSNNVDEELLTEIAQRTGGQYFAAENLDSLQGIYEHIDELEPIENEGQVVRPKRSLFHFPLAAAICLFGIAWLVHFRRNV